MGNANAGFGTTISMGGNVIAEVTKITPPGVNADTIETTTLNSVNGFREYIGAMPDGGEVSIEGNLYLGDANGQVALANAVGTVQSFVINLPSSMGASWSFSAVVTAFEPGDIVVDDKIPFSASLKVTGKPQLNISVSTGLTTPFFTLSGAGTLAPVASGSVFDYVFTVATAVSSITVTPTASSGVITINGNTVSSGQASSAIPLGTAGSVTVITLQVQESGKSPKVYTIRVQRP